MLRFPFGLKRKKKGHSSVHRGVLEPSDDVMPPHRMRTNRVLQNCPGVPENPTEFLPWELCVSIYFTMNRPLKPTHSTPFFKSREVRGPGEKLLWASSEDGPRSSATSILGNLRFYSPSFHYFSILAHLILSAYESIPGQCCGSRELDVPRGRVLSVLPRESSVGGFSRMSGGKAKRPRTSVTRRGIDIASNEFHSSFCCSSF